MWTNIGVIVFVAIWGFFLYRNRNGIRALFKESKEAPQYWGTFILIMLALAVFVYILIKL